MARSIQVLSVVLSRLDASGAHRLKRLAELIEQTTKIPLAMFEGRQTLEDYNIVTKMRWAANRHTTKQEDVAYSLMGIFGVQLTLQYGEGGEYAFIRLQKKILKQTDDESIFVWADPRGPSNRRLDLLALFPECFDVPDVDY